MITSDRGNASREAEELILSIYEEYQKSQDKELMDTMKRLTIFNHKL